jgi:5'-nucleotidase
MAPTDKTHEKAAPQPGKLVVAVASRALFDLDESHGVFESEGEDAYARYQIRHEDEVLAPGVAFSLVRKLLALNRADSASQVEIILLSRNSADTSLRIFKSIEHYGIDIQRAVFTRGRTPYSYAGAFGAHLFLSANQEDVRLALDAGIAAATVLQASALVDGHSELRIAFDGDAVLFSDEAEKIFQQAGLEAFNRNEVASKDLPLTGGPFKHFLSALHALQASVPSDQCPIRTALITARSAPAHERVVRTLRAWGIRIDEALFLGGLDKGVFLKSFGADIFFDDQHKNCLSASNFVATGHVPFGIKNRLQAVY